MNSFPHQSFRSELSWLQEDKLGELQRLKEQLLSEGRQLFDLSMINPDLAPARVLVDKLVEASLKPYNHRYSVSRGIRRLREAFASKYQAKFAVELDPDSEVCVTMGAKDAMLDALLSLASPGQHILLGTPTYPAHLSAARLAGLSPVFFEVSSDENAMLIAIESALKAQPIAVLALNFPNNPTGHYVSADFYRKLGAIAVGSNVFILNDFTYGEMGFAPGVSSLLAADGARERCAEIYSLSKAYSIPGWRVAALVGSARLIRQVAKLKSHIDYGVFLPLQMAASYALSTKEDLVKPLVAQYNNRCSTLSTGLRSNGWTVQEPRSGACVWAKAPRDLSSQGSLELCRNLLRDCGILAMPGLLFGEQCDEYVRFAAVVSEEYIREVVERIGRIGLSPSPWRTANA
jgi:alanine-synthesizing transaminase